MMTFAERVARDTTAITDAEVQSLREHGFTDAQIFDIAAAAAARCFSASSSMPWEHCRSGPWAKLKTT